MRHKYIDENFPTWFIFGEYKDGRVDVNDGDRDIVTKISREEAEKLIKIRDDLQEVLYILLPGYSKATIERFDKITELYGQYNIYKVVKWRKTK